MSGFFTTGVRNGLLNHLLGGPDRARAATLYLAGLTTAPAIDGSGFVEAAYADYARVAKTNNDTNFPAAANGQKTNGTQIDFPEVGAGQVGTINIVGFGVFEQALGGTPIAYAPAAKAITALDTLYVAAATLAFELNNAA